jgi:hypothetical protein
VILAVLYTNGPFTWPKDEDQRFQKDSLVVIGRRKHHMVGYFPPTAADPVLRIAFPRDVQPSDKRVVFQLYLPGISFPEREAEFDVKDVMYRGKPEL